MRFPGRFADQLIAGALDRISLSFLVDDLIIRRGGVAANVAYGMALLGQQPVLVGAAGRDFTDYRSWLQRHGVDCDSVLISDTAHTARFVCTTDDDNCQIATFYPGAMTQAAAIDLATVIGAGPVDLVLISPDNPTAMLRHADTCRRMGLPFAADPSQQLAHMSGSDIAAFITKARYLFTNEYEYTLLLSKLAVSEAVLLDMVETVVCTLAADGVRLRTRQGVTQVPAVPVASVVDPTGGGDAFRAGFLTGAIRGLRLAAAAALGCQLAAYAIAEHGTQEYLVAPDRLIADLTAHYGAVAATAVRAALAPQADPARPAPSDR
ncbi:carbohydrate kinase family protein [Micromonospora sp. C95]|uniref:carbohydrate kinase family protein n=1 Tax=Micromonospora sp. C95 TaxID=2824882 RepID=UPI001B37A890|nr:carbohydrate kinase family protein [Micromonospora sp. C95]MBQ1023697.1 carbohydrate kinase family protein [Micromonospora sp. C95]